MQVLQAMEQRSSCRDFEDRPVPRQTLEQLMTLACRAPSAINLQPWRFTVVMNDEVARLSKKLMQAHRERGLGCKPDNVRPMPDVFLERQAELNKGMKPLLIEAGADLANFINHGSLSFYGAPAVVAAALHRAFPDSRSLDVGIALGWLLIAARELGLDTCPIGLICAYADEMADYLNIDDDWRVVLAVAVGYGKPDSPVNRMRSPRAPLKQVVRWY